MSRPTDWSPLAGSDPVPGDAAEVRSLARRYRDTADEISKQAGNLRRLSEVDGWKTEAGRKFSSKAGDLANAIEKAKGRYDGSSEALYDWASALEAAQDDADGALRRAKSAQATMDANQPPDRPIEDPTPEQQAAETRRSEDYQAASGALSGARTDFDTAVGAYDKAAGKAGDRIDEAGDDDLKDSGWDKFKDWAKSTIKKYADVLKVISDVLGVVATIVGVVGLILSFTPLAPLGAALQGVALGLTVAKLLVDSALVFAGEGSWTDVGLGLLAVATFGVGRYAGTLGKAAVSTAKQSATAANAARAARATQSVKDSHRFLGLFQSADDVLARGTRIPLVSRLRSMTTQPYLDDVATQIDDAVRASQGAVDDVTTYPGLRSALLHGGTENAQRMATINRLAGEFPEVARTIQLSGASQAAASGATWANTGIAETANLATGQYPQTGEKLRDFYRWTRSQLP